jgi:lipoate-protein ligase A
VGSAQRRARGAVLQHGSIRIHPDSPRVARAAGLVPGVAISLEELGVTDGLKGVRERCLEAFQRRFSGGIEAARFTAEEQFRAAQSVRSFSMEREGLTPISPRGSQEGPSATDR